jgi:purine-binding chemotaxis protein CheW
MDQDESQKKEQSSAAADGFAIVARAGARLPQSEPAQLDASANERGGQVVEATTAPLAKPADPLEEFFYREEEPGSPLLELGVAAVARREAESPEEVRREFLAFLLGSEEYGIEIGNVREIVKPPPITEVPRAAPHILGVITVRGEVIAVIDPRRRLGLPQGTPTSLARVIVCDVGEGSCGLLVDMVSEVVRLSPSAIEVRPQSMSVVDTDYLAGIGRDGERLIILLDAGLLLRRRAAAEESLT